MVPFVNDPANYVVSRYSNTSCSGVEANSRSGRVMMETVTRAGKMIHRRAEYG